MVNFFGKYTSKLDDKGRLVLPAPLKGALPEGGDMRFVVRKDIFADCLEMYAYPEWERQAAEVKSRLNFFNVEHATFWRAYMRDCVIVEPDAKFGRINFSTGLGLQRKWSLSATVSRSRSGPRRPTSPPRSRTKTS